MKRLLLALIPVALLASVSFAYPVLNPEPSSEPAPALVAGPGGTATNSSPTAPAVVAQAPATQTVAQQPATPPAQPAPAPAVTDESVPPLVVDKSQLVEAAALLERAIQQAKVAADATGVQAQQAAIQQTISLLAGSASVNSQTGQAMTTSAGVVPLLSQALTAREAAEQQWLVALEQRDSQIYVAGPGGTIPPAATSNIKLGTQGLRPEEQASLLVSRAILQATNALRVAVMPAEAESVEDRGTAMTGVSDEASDMMLWVARQLESALKIVQIAINR